MPSLKGTCIMANLALQRVVAGSPTTRSQAGDGSRSTKNADESVCLRSFIFAILDTHRVDLSRSGMPTVECMS